MTARRTLVAAAVAIAGTLLGVGCGGASSPTAPEVVREVAAIPGAGAGSPLPAYNRDDWQHWIDEDGDCQDTRAEVLIRESREPVTFRPRTDGRPCVVDTGLWLDPYSGQTFTAASSLDVDHVVPLANAHRYGGWAWDAAQKRAYANDLADPRHLMPVSASLNRFKSDRGPEVWLPPNESYLCAYGEAWSAIKARWGLTMMPEEASAVAGLLSRCS